MSLAACIAGLRAKGQIDADRAQFYLEHFNELRAEYEKTMGRFQAEALATRETVEAVGRQMSEARRQKLLQLRTQEGIATSIAAHVAAGGRAGDAAIAVFDKVEGVNGIASLEGRRQAVLAMAHSKMTGLLQRFSTDLAGRTRNAAQLGNVIREAFGHDTGDLAARELLHSWAQTAEMLRQRFNAAGGHMAKLEDWGLPQFHDSLKVRQASYEAWRDFILPRLDLRRMKDGATGKPLTTVQLNKALRAAYESIRTEGMDDMVPGFSQPQRLANTRAEARFLLFKDADGWLEYQQAFGTPNPWDAMMGHIDAMARDIAQMEILGPAPTTTVRWLTDLLQKDAMTSRTAGRAFDKLRDRAFGAASQIERMYAVFNGETNRPVSGTLARGFSTVRSLQQAAKLGAAMLSAVTDLGFTNVTARFNGLEHRRIIAHQLRLLNPLNAADRELAISAGLIAEEAGNRMGQVWRYENDANTPEVARRLASGVIRLSGLSAWTQAGKWAFGMEFMGALARAAKIEWGALDPKLQAAMARYGIDAADWDVLRATPLYEHRGAQFLRPDEVTNQAVQNKLLEAIATETRLAVPVPTLRARAIMTGGLRAGTWSGELWRSVLQLKGFPVSVLMTHGARMVNQKSISGKAAYAANLLIMTTTLGALAAQMKDISNGKDARDMTTGKFWWAALAQGGGLGLIGDFLYADTNRYGGSATGTLLGPTVGTAYDLADLTIGNARQGLTDKKTNAGRELTRFLDANTPGSSLWYARLAFQRILWDQLQQELDPQAHAAWARMEAKAKRELDQEFWWEPGETAPDRAPQLDSIDGGSR